MLTAINLTLSAAPQLRTHSATPSQQPRDVLHRSPTNTTLCSPRAHVFVLHASHARKWVANHHLRLQCGQPARGHARYKHPAGATLGGQPSVAYTSSSYHPATQIACITPINKRVTGGSI